MSLCGNFPTRSLSAYWVSFSDSATSAADLAFNADFCQVFPPCEIRSFITAFKRTHDDVFFFLRHKEICFQEIWNFLCFRGVFLFF